MLAEPHQALRERSDPSMNIGMHGSPSPCLQFHQSTMDVLGMMVLYLVQHPLHVGAHVRFRIRGDGSWAWNKELLNPLIIRPCHAPHRTHHRFESRAHQGCCGDVKARLGEKQLAVCMLPDDLAEAHHGERPVRLGPRSYRPEWIQVRVKQMRLLDDRLKQSTHSFFPQVRSQPAYGATRRRRHARWAQERKAEVRIELRSESGRNSTLTPVLAPIVPMPSCNIEPRGKDSPFQAIEAAGWDGKPSHDDGSCIQIAACSMCCSVCDSKRKSTWHLRDERW